MIDKNKNNIVIGRRCLVNGTNLGLVTGTKNEYVTVLMLNDGGQTCFENLVLPRDVEMK